MNKKHTSTFMLANELSMSESESTGHVDPFATEWSFEVEDVSSPESPPINYNYRCLEPYQFEPYMHTNYPLNTHLNSLI